MIKAAHLTFFFVFLSFSCANASQSLDEIKGMRGHDAVELSKKDRRMRPKIIHDTGYTLGVQSGAKWRNGKIQEELNAQGKSLDRIYNFKQLLIDGRVMPPVVIDSDDNLSVLDKQIVSVSKSYKIIKDAHFVSTSPSWRDYLSGSYFSVKEVNRILLPRTSEEVDIWEEAVEKGWIRGIKQADSIFKLNMRKLTRDMRGVILYRLLAGQGLVSMPRIESDRFAIRVGDKTLDLNERVFVIRRDAHFQQEDQWEPFRKNR